MIYNVMDRKHVARLWLVPAFNKVPLKAVS